MYKSQLQSIYHMLVQWKNLGRGGTTCPNKTIDGSSPRSVVREHQVVEMKQK